MVVSPIPTTVNTVENDNSGNQLSPESSVLALRFISRASASFTFLLYSASFFPAATFFGSLFFDAGFASGTLVICSLSSDVVFINLLSNLLNLLTACLQLA